MRPSILPLSALVLLASFAAPAASATSHCVVDPGTGGLVCFGDEWCTNDGLCGIPVCVDDSMRVCINEAPDDRPEGCVIAPTSNLGLVCFGEPWCTDAMCGVPVCLTHRRNVCVNEAP